MLRPSRASCISWTAAVIERDPLERTFKLQWKSSNFCLKSAVSALLALVADSSAANMPMRAKLLGAANHQKLWRCSGRSFSTKAIACSRRVRAASRQMVWICSGCSGSGPG